jgi:hypothetical protein
MLMNIINLLTNTELCSFCNKRKLKKNIALIQVVGYVCNVCVTQNSMMLKRIINTFKSISLTKEEIDSDIEKSVSRHRKSLIDYEKKLQKIEEKENK